MIIDGRDCAGFLYDMSTGEYEWFMYDRGYTAIPKDNIISVSRQDLVEHPDKFRPYMYSRSSWFSISYEDMAEKGFKHIRYSDGRDIIVCNADDHTSFENEDELVQDLVYMRENYQNLYDKLVTTSDIPEIFVKVDKCMADKQGQSSLKHDATVKQQASGGKARHTTPTITPDQVNIDKLPERITYIRKKVGNGFVFVLEDEQADSKAVPKAKSGSKDKPTNTATINTANIHNAMQTYSGQQQQPNQTSTEPNYNPVAGMISTTGERGQAHIVNKPMPDFMAEDIDLNDAFIRIDADKDIAGFIMKPDGTKYIVANNPVRPAQPIQQIAAVPIQTAPISAPATPAQTVPQTQDPAIPTLTEAFDPSTDQQLKSVVEKLHGAGTFNVKLNTECGVTKVLVEDANGKIMDNLCFTVDLVGVCQTPDRKMWFGLPEIPDFAPSYAFNDAAINMIFTGEGEENLSPVFNAETCKLNRLVNLHSIFNIPGLDAATILSMMKVIKGIINKRSVKIELEKRDNMNVRFTIGNFKDPKNFRLILQNRTYLYNGGPLSNNKNKSFYIEVQNNQMKLYTGKKSKQQHTTITPEQEETNKRITAILNEQISTKPSDIVNPNNQEEPNVVIEDLDPMPETVTA